jgi:hypothetical protein
VNHAIDHSSPAPNFMIIGASKAGTTSLQHYLSQHPDVFLPVIKETCYFISSARTVSYRGPWEEFTINRDRICSWGDYLGLYQGAGSFPARGEICPSYLRTAGTAQRIHQKLGDIKIIVILRNPVIRAFSEYCMRKGLGVENLEFEEALTAETANLRENWYGGRYLQGGLYGEQLQEFYKVYPSEKIKILLFEDMINSPSSTLDEVCEFLGLSRFSGWDTSDRYNRSGDINNSFLRFLWVNSNTLRGILRPLLPLSVRRRISIWIGRLSRNKPVLQPKTAEQLMEYYSQDIRTCEELTSVDLDHWRG